MFSLKNSHAQRQKRFHDRRIVHRVDLDPYSLVSYCEIFDFNENETFYGRIHNLSPGGMCLSLKRGVTLNSVLLVIFIDDVTARKISTYVRVLDCQGVRFNGPFFDALCSFIEFLMGKTLFYRRYRCQIYPSPHVSEAFRELYHRLLNDNHLAKMAHQPIVVHRQKSLVGDPAQGAIRFKLAETKEEREAAYRLVYDEYLKRRFIAPNTQKIFTSLYHLLPSTMVFVGLKGNEVVMTLTAVKDSPLKLPMDLVFGDLLDVFRERERSLIEFTTLAIRPDVFGQTDYSVRAYHRMDKLLAFFRFAMKEVLQRNGVTDLVITIHKRYARFYRDFYFKPLGSPRRYTQFRNKCVTALWLDLEKARDVKFLKSVGRNSLYSYFFKGKAFGQTTPPPNPYLTKEDIQYLFKEKSSLLEEMTPQQETDLFRFFPTLKEKIQSIKTVQ